MFVKTRPTIECSTDELNESAWGDIVCPECSFIIATITVNEPGKYVFKKVVEK